MQKRDHIVVRCWTACTQTNPHNGITKSNLRIHGKFHQPKRRQKKKKCTERNRNCNGRTKVKIAIVLYPCLLFRFVLPGFSLVCLYVYAGRNIVVDDDDVAAGALSLCVWLTLLCNHTNISYVQRAKGIHFIQMCLWWHHFFSLSAPVLRKAHIVYHFFVMVIAMIPWSSNENLW